MISTARLMGTIHDNRKNRHKEPVRVLPPYKKKKRKKIKSKSAKKQQQQHPKQQPPLPSPSPPSPPPPPPPPLPPPPSCSNHGIHQFILRSRCKIRRFLSIKKEKSAQDEDDMNVPLLLLPE